jgi:hypothetical protein
MVVVVMEHCDEVQLKMGEGCHVVDEAFWVVVVEEEHQPVREPFLEESYLLRHVEPLSWHGNCDLETSNCLK